METTNNPSMGNPPENYLILSIMATIFCCWPIGIFAILKAAKVRELWALGDHVGAQKASNDAKKLTIWGAVGWLLIIVIPIAIMASLGVFATIMDGTH